MTEHRNHWHLVQLQNQMKSGALDPAQPVDQLTLACPGCGQPYVASAIGRKAHAKRRPACTGWMQ